MKEKVEALLKRLTHVEEELSRLDILNDKKRFRILSQEHAYLIDIKELFLRIKEQEKQLKANQALLKEEADPEFLKLIEDDIHVLEQELHLTKEKLETLLVPPDPNDHANVIMELRAGTGGEEAALFVGDCVRMYRLYADRMQWKVETLSLTHSAAGGFKEYIMSLSGQNVHRFLQYEAGTHRVQRVPATEAQGRLHTSAITVAILMEPSAEEKIDIDESDLKIDTYRSSGAGGQHVNTTDSAVRITHIPTGVVVYCQEERSQHKNKDKALRVLAARLKEERMKKEREERASLRLAQVGSGDRSERIRTYNFPQNRLTDHRVPDLTLYQLDRIMEGHLEQVTQALIKHFYQKNFAESN